MSEERKEFFFSYRSGKSRQVSREEWEKEWLDWWAKKSADAKEEEESS